MQKSILINVQLLVERTWPVEPNRTWQSSRTSTRPKPASYLTPQKKVDHLVWTESLASPSLCRGRVPYTLDCDASMYGYFSPPSKGRATVDPGLGDSQQIIWSPYNQFWLHKFLLFKRCMQHFPSPACRAVKTHGWTSAARGGLKFDHSRPT